MDVWTLVVVSLKTTAMSAVLSTSSVMLLHCVLPVHDVALRFQTTNSNCYSLVQKTSRRTWKSVTRASEVHCSFCIMNDMITLINQSKRWSISKTPTSDVFVILRLCCFWLNYRLKLYFQLFNLKWSDNSDIITIVVWFYDEIRQSICHGLIMWRVLGFSLH